MYSGVANQYKKMEMESASQGKLLLRLYDGALDFIELAVEHHTKKNAMEYRHYIGKVQAIVNELMSTLNMEAGDIAQNLFLLYEFMLRQLLDAYKAENIEQVYSVQHLIKGLRDAWEVVVNGTVSIPQPSPETESAATEPETVYERPAAQPVARRTPYGAYAGAAQSRSVEFSG